MRTTVILDDRLVREAKKRAAESRTSLSAVINAALRDTLAKRVPEARGRFRLPTFGAARLLSHEPAEIKALWDEDKSG